MNRPAMSHAKSLLRKAVIAALAPFALSACNAPADSPPAQGPLVGAAIGGDFTLTGEDGQTVRWRDFAGQWRVVYFGYTFCPDVCPVDAAAIGQGLSRFEKQAPGLGAKVTPLFITVDPARDTPAVLREFTANFHPRMLGLTGSEAQIAETAKKFAVWYQKGEPAPGGGYLVNHTNQAVLFDPDGKPIALLPTDKGGPAVAEELAKWVK